MSKHIGSRLLSALLLSGLLAALAPSLAHGQVDKRVREAEKKRIEVIAKVQPAVVAVMTGGGSGVLIDEDGYALTNFHVTNAAGGPLMKCGLADGILYDAVLVGLDKVGDVALIKLLPKKPGDKFPFAKLGDSDKVKAGDWSLAMGNPFLLATDFTPTVTYGLVSGVHRYQYPSGTLLEYTDCIQIDTSINPGNSGGPLFNMDGELIGINGRGSFEKRGRVNSGVGYAISINQIKNFLGQLRAGMDTDHASLGALLESETDEGVLSKMVVRGLLECDAKRRGLELGDELMWFAGRPLTSVNQYKNVLGLYPKGWRVPLTYRHNNTEKHEVLVRLMGVQRQEIIDRLAEGQPPQPGPGGRPAPQPLPNTPAAKLFEAKAGFANYYFNKLERDKLMNTVKGQGDFSTVQGTWIIKGKGLVKGREADVEVSIRDKGGKDGKSDLIEALVDGLDYSLEPLSSEKKLDVFKDPPGSGGMLIALYQYRQLLAYGEKGFSGEFSHGGVEPFYLLSAEKERPDFTKQRVDCEVLRTRHAGFPTKWYFALKDDAERKIAKGQLLGFELSIDREEDPCEVYLSDYQKVDGRMLPQRIAVVQSDKTFCSLKSVQYKLAGVK
jgi:serine protease Do